MDQTTMLYIQTGEMRQLMENYSEVCYVVNAFLLYNFELFFNFHKKNLFRTSWLKLAPATLALSRYLLSTKRGLDNQPVLDFSGMMTIQSSVLFVKPLKHTTPVISPNLLFPQ
jgi:hypothetical protein